MLQTWHRARVFCFEAGHEEPVPSRAVDRAAQVQLDTLVNGEIREGGDSCCKNVARSSFVLSRRLSRGASNPIDLFVAAYVAMPFKEGGAGARCE